MILPKDPEKRRASFEYLLFGTSAASQALIVENTGYMPVNSGSLALLKDFYAEHPQFATSAAQIDRAFPWFGWPSENGARISRLVLDTMAAIANGQVTGKEAAVSLANEIKDLLPRG